MKKQIAKKIETLLAKEEKLKTMLDDKDVKGASKKLKKLFKIKWLLIKEKSSQDLSDCRWS